jgi:3-isopropylmalate/(R)-2-methylmalate dehydratase small subunit
MNTDAIIPAPYLRSPSADLAAGLFARLRTDDDGAEVPGFVLNQAPYRAATILLGGPNFGCGSSREAAAWALLRYGIRCVVAPSFADIFYENAFRNGLLPAIIAADGLDAALAQAGAQAHGGRFAVDLNSCVLTCPDGRALPFAVPEDRKQALLAGEDDIAVTLRFDADITAFAARDGLDRPWIYNLEAAA